MKSLLILPFIAVTSCTMVGPNYEAPDTKVAATYKSVGLSAPLPAANWWKSFSDPTLNSLLARAEKNNPSARAALARLDQSRSILGLSRADALPYLEVNALAQRQKESVSDRFPALDDPFSRYQSSLNLSYEVDMWGVVRREIAQQQATTEAVAGD